MVEKLTPKSDTRERFHELFHAAVVLPAERVLGMSAQWEYHLAARAAIMAASRVHEIESWKQRSMRRVFQIVQFEERYS